MCKYEIVGDTEGTRFWPQTDGQTDDVKPVYPLFNFVEAEGIIMHTKFGSEFSWNKSSLQIYLNFFPIYDKSA